MIVAATLEDVPVGAKFWLLTEPGWRESDLARAQYTRSGAEEYSTPDGRVMMCTRPQNVTVYLEHEGLVRDAEQQRQAPALGLLAQL